MDCSEVRDIIDAYALGAGTPEEAALIESHVAECVDCWNELGKAQRTAALVAFSAPMVDVPEGLEDRIMSIARQEAEMETKERPVTQPPLMQRLGLSWASAAAGLGVASVAALAFAGFLQSEVNDLRAENTRMESQMNGTTQELEGRVREANEAADTAGGILLSLVSTSPQGVEMNPSALSEDPRLLPLPWVPSPASETRMVEGVQPVAPKQVSRTKISPVVLVSPATRLLAKE